MATSVDHKPRPYSAYNPSSPVPFVINTRFSSETPIIYTMPSQSKGMGAKIEKEELYEQNMHLKKRNNKLKSELDEAKSTIVKKDIELRKKEKIIEDLSKENDIQIVQEENFAKARESTLVTLVKRKYYEMKNNYEKVLKENEILKSNIKLTKIKEIKIETDILGKELEKMKNLYNHVQDQNKNNLNEISQLQSFQNEYFKQHQLICALRENYEKSKEDYKHNNEELFKTKEKLSKTEANCRKLKLEIQKLKSTNEKYLTEKRGKEKIIMTQTDYQRKIAELSSELKDYKNLYKQYQQQNNNGTKTSQPATNYNVITPTYQDDSEEYKKKISLYESLIRDSDIKISIYEEYIKEKGGNPSKILKDKGYDGVINPTSVKKFPTRTINTAKPKPKSPKVEPIDDGKLNNYVIKREELDDNYFNIVDNVFKLFKIVFEGNKITKEYLNQSLEDIYAKFENQEEMNKEEFIEPFINLFIHCSKTSIEYDKKFIEQFINDLLENNNNDTTAFYDLLQILNNSIVNYSELENEKVLTEQIKEDFSQVQNDLLNYLKENYSNDSVDYIDYTVFNYIIEQKLRLKLQPQIYDYVLYKMRENLPDISIFLLNIKYIKQLLTGSSESSENNSSSKNSNKNNESNSGAKENNNLIEPKKSFDNYSNHSNHSNRSNRSNNSNRSNHSDYNRNDNDNNENNDNNDYLVEHSLKDYVVNENEFLKESGKILAAMVYNFISFDTFFQEHIQVDEFSNVKMIQDEKFFEKLNTLHLDLTEKEMNDFKKTYRFEDNKSMLDVEKIKEDLKNVKIDDLPVDGLREEVEVEN